MLFYHLKHGKLSFIGKPIFMTMVTVELLYERMVDGLKGKHQSSKLVDNELTAIIKTFERPAALKRLINSIRRFYPKMKIIVVDDSREPSMLDGVENIVMEYDSGVSAGRNRALEAVKTKYTLLLDDDFVFYRKTVLANALEAMDNCSEIDIMGGVTVNLPLYRVVDYKEAKLFPVKKESLKVKGTFVAGFPVYDKIANFYIARTDRLKLVAWDSNLKRLDHADFFTRAKGVLLSVYNKEFKVLHAQTPYNDAYMKKRFSIEDDQKRLRDKYYASSLLKQQKKINE